MAENEDHVFDNDETPSATNEGPEENTSGPQPQSGEEETLTPEDILATEQTDEAKQADEANLNDEENPYLEDLRRLTAEFANYRKRVENNRELELKRSRATVIEPLLGVLDDLDRAEAHGDLTEGSAFLTIAQKIRSSLEKLGLEGFGATGEAFDPQHHEAIAQVPVPGTEDQVILEVIERGYRIGEVELRPAKVAVAVNPDG